MWFFSFQQFFNLKTLKLKFILQKASAKITELETFEPSGPINKKRDVFMNYNKKWSCSNIQKNGIKKSNPNLNDSAAMFGYEKSGTVAINDFLKNEKNQSKCVSFFVTVKIFFNWPL